MNIRRSLLVACVLAGASWQAMACYTVYDSSSRVMYRAEQAPVDMSRPLHETVPARFPGGQMVFDDVQCSSLPMGLPSSQPSRTPLLTDRHTAQTLGVSYAVLSRDIVVVPAREAAVAQAALPDSIMVIPGEHSVAMGGPPARPLQEHRPHKAGEHWR
jgi:hypothetical protein